MAQAFPFKRTNRAIYQKPASVLTDDNLYWKKLGSPTLVKELGAIDYLDFSSIEPYNFAATCSVRIQIYNPITKLVTRNLRNFREAAYGGSYRSDGRLLVAGGEEKSVKVFDVHARLLRLFTGHTAPVHRTLFTKEQTRVVSFSDDKSVSVWDVAAEQRVVNFADHADYVRAGAASPISPDVILSGGYDNLLKLYDCRSSETILTVNHGSPVETAIFLPSGGIFISGGGTEIKVWDVFNGGRLLANISQHHKTVTALRLATNNSRLLSASLDRHVKVYDISTFRVVHSMDFPNAVLSLAVSEGDDTLVAGMVDGIISIRKRQEPVKRQEDKKTMYKFAPDHLSSSTVVENPYEKKKDNRWNDHMRKFEYGKAVEVVLKPYISVKTPDITVAVFQELLRQGVAHLAFSQLREERFGLLIKFLAKHIGVPRFSRTVIDCANVLVDVFDGGERSPSQEAAAQLKKLHEQVYAETEACRKLCELEGAIGLLLAGAHAAAPPDPADLPPALEPSHDAHKFSIAVQTLRDGSLCCSTSRTTYAAAPPDAAVLLLWIFQMQNAMTSSV